MGRAPCCDKANVKKGPWSPEEDARLKAYIEKYGTGGNWIALPQKIGLKRCGKSCRLRWLNYLRPNIKHGGFTEEEDNIICSLYISIGSRWSIIAAQLPGRTDNDIKNYWNTRLKKKLLGRRKQSNKNRLSIPSQEPKDATEENSSYNLQNLSTSALERLQLHMHLQGLQKPFPFHNDPSLWPKTTQTPHSLSENQNNLILGQMASTPQPPPLAPDQQDYSPLTNLKNNNELEQSFNGFSSSESSFALNTDQNNLLESNMMERNAGIDQLMSTGFTQAELDDLLSCDKSSSFLPTDTYQIGTEHDCFREMDVSNSSRDSLAWLTNEFDANSAPLNSWDSATMLHRSEESMYQDYNFMQGYRSYM